MNKRKLQIRVLALIVFIFLVNYLAMRFHWYSLLPWFDMFMHFLGGFWLSLAVILMFPFPGNTLRFFWRTILLVLLIGFLWEVFEIVVKNIIFLETFDFRDTVSDIFFDLSGALIALVYFLQRIMHRLEDKL